MRFFVETKQITEKEISIIGNDYNHIINVLRNKVDDILEIVDQQNNYYKVRIAKIGQHEITTEIIKKEKSAGQSIQVALAQSLPKGKKIELIIQKATELGAAEIIPFISQRTIAIPNKESINHKVSRWQKIAESAAQQSNSSKIPQIKEIIGFTQLLTRLNQYELCLIPWEEEISSHLKDVLRRNTKTKSILIIIGPEGGFSKDEILKAKKSGAIPVSLGTQTLRTETAPIMALSCVNYEYEI